MTIVHEESFGPILPVLKFKSFDEVIGYANDCEYGLAAMVFTNNMNTIMKCNDELEYGGEIYVNRGHGEQHQVFITDTNLVVQAVRMENMVLNSIWRKRLSTLDIPPLNQDGTYD